MSKLKVLQINTVYKKGSTGKIVAGIETICNERDIETYVAYRYFENPDVKENEISVSSWLDCHVHNRLSTYTGFQGVFSYFGTKKFIRELDKINPDIIHLHNIHGSFINHKLLFDYIKKHDIKTIWTLHDCWAFTGLCAHFDFYKCEKWVSGCGNCVYCKNERFPLFDCTKLMWKKKKKILLGIRQLLVVTPSSWLAGLVKKSYLANYPVRVINNGIDLTIFKPFDSDFRKRYNCDNKFIILGVAFDWGRRKGLDVFIELSKRTGTDIQIILVGTNDEIDKQLPDNIITIHRTCNQHELAQIYSAADLLVNPTREDNFPTVNIESIACGTPVLTFDTGGSSEMLNESCGCTVPCDDIEALYERILYIKANHPYSTEDCVKHAANYDMNTKFKEYVDLYEDSTHFSKRSIQ